MRIRFLVIVAALMAAPRIVIAQDRGAAALGEAVEGLGTSVRVLMIGAHPDDEDTQLIAYLATGRHVETAYLSLTRGDGGQNLIGNELGPLLGMIRTQELLSARRIDGGRQYFTRAYDFGFSKTAAETFKHWPRDSILRDMISVIRAFRPQVVISVWSGTPRDGHGHHQVSGILSRIAFDLAGDTVRYPRSATNGLGGWTPTLFYRSARVFGGRARGAPPPEGAIAFDVGAYDALAGRTYAALAAESRSQHRSQGQGNMAPLDDRMDYVRLEESRAASAPRHDSSLFAGVDSSFGRFASLPLPGGARSALDSLDAARAEVGRHVSLVNPSTMVAPIARYLALVERARAGAPASCRAPGMPVPVCSGAMGDFATTMDEQARRARQALLLASGVQLLATAPRDLIAIGDSAPVTITVVNHGATPVQCFGRNDESPARTIAPGDLAEQTYTLAPRGEPTMPWWLRYPLQGDMFSLRDPRDTTGTPVPQLLEGEDRVEGSGARVGLEIAGTQFETEITPIVHRYADPAIGEVDTPIAFVPAVTVRLDREIEYARADTKLDRVEHVAVRSGWSGPRAVTVTLDPPAGLAADSPTRRLTLAPGEEADLYFRVRGTLAPGAHTLSVSATSDGQRFATGYVTVDYPHIRTQRYYRPATLTIEAVDVRYAANLTVAYVPGVGDNVEPMLSQLGLHVTTVQPDEVAQTDLSKYSAVVVGPRAFDASEALRAGNGRLLAYAGRGGTLVEQYGQYGMARPGILPYPITLSRPADRVTEEDAAVTILDPASPLLNVPNKITAQDFANWVQERSSYMPHTFDSRYHAILSMHDTDEPPNDAGILTAAVGKGTFVYATLSFFRQLPAGNPGAARLFVNLLSARPGAAQGPDHQLVP
ncbi:MAG: PIG-L family deacetylase [Gemmatimonadota bacterium]|nr:PIG-L family deacetylase [Gemmatimonadota bacterium]